MATSGDVTIAQDGGQSIKLHPYLVALVRWCVSCVWSTATVLLHRLVAGSLPAPAIRIARLTVSKPAQKTRAPGRDHLHPEPKVECQVLHTPTTHSCDVIFVHGLYGSLANTWRQGDWRSKYKQELDKIPLLRPTDCKCENEDKFKINENKLNEYEDKLNEIAYKDMQEKFCDGIKKILPNEEAFIAEKFYNNTLLDQVEIVDNYETQAKFVRDLFESENRINESKMKNVNDLNYESEANGVRNEINEVNCKCKVENGGKINEDILRINESNCECKINEDRKCKVGCGCVCDVCYSSCWPKDWIKEDYPEARVISINYTSDPYLWRPLWVKECKRLRLHERAQQMISQLLELRVGEKPIIWVGHSKGGLFIKQIYCEAYEAYLKTQCHSKDREKNYKDENFLNNPSDFENNNAVSEQRNSIFENHNCNLNEVCSSINEDINDNFGNIDNRIETNNVMSFENERIVGEKGKTKVNFTELSSNREEDYSLVLSRLWHNSAGFMFYSVPHRGSPLADIKTPLTARSIELLEISKDCALVLSLQARWLEATSAADAGARVRSIVETRRTLMGLLYLSIVSVTSADAGIGALYGISVDHREICKPSSRSCLLYQELMTLMRAALARCKCDKLTQNVT